MQKLFYFSWILSISMYLGACKSDYEKMLSRELATGIRQDSLVFGMKLGMTRDSFFKHCFQLNLDGLVTSGPTNTTALYKVLDAGKPIDFNFYLKFNANKAVMMDATFSYPQWSFWNKDQASAVLMPEAVGILKKWFNCDFLELQKKEQRVFVAVQGNRQIRVFLKNDQYVGVEIKDLTAPEPDATN